jgi:hypothetical protein
MRSLMAGHRHSLGLRFGGAFFVAITVAAGLFSGAEPLAQESREVTFDLGLVRVDGQMVPVTVASGQALNSPALWDFWPSSRLQLRGHLRAGAVTEVQSHCSALTAVETDVPAGPMPESMWVQSFPLDLLGVATRGSVTMTDVDPIYQSTALWNDVERAALADFDPRERRDGLGLVETPRPRASLRSAFIGSGGASPAIYFVAQKEYRRVTSAECPVATVGSGWLLRDSSGALRVAAARMVQTDCDWKEVSTLAPVAVAHARDGRVLWITREYGWEDEQVVILEVERSRVRRILEVDQGAC